MNHLLFSFHSCPFEPPGTGLSGGMNTFLSGLLPALHLHGIRTDVLTRGFGETVVVTHPAPGVRVIHLPCGWDGKAPTREGALRALPRFVASARLWLGSGAGNYSVISAHYWMSGVAARVIFGAPTKRDSAAIPLAFSFHTVEARKIRPEATVPDAPASARMAAERALAGSVDALVCFSSVDLAETVKLFPEAGPRGVVIPPGIDERFRRPPDREFARKVLGLTHSGTLFLLASRADSGKNAAAAVEAVGRLREARGMDVTLLVAGQERPAGADGCDGVIYLGPVRHDDMPLFYAVADGVVCPSLYESFGLAPLESLAAGTPVVVPKTTYWGGRVGAEGGGLAYDPSDPTALEEALRRLASDPLLRAFLSDESRRLAVPFTWTRSATSWSSLLSRLSSRGGRPETPRFHGALRRR